MDISKLESYSERPNAFIFKYKKIGKHFIHTLCEGKLLQKFGLHSKMVVNQTLYDFLPAEIAKKKEKFYDLAWQGNNINYEGSLNGVYYLAVLMPIKKNNRIIEVMATAFDITMEKDQERRIQKAEKLAVVGQLAAGVAHEIRNPLTSVKGFAQILLEKIEDEAERNYLEIMLGELNRIQNIVNEFMLLANPKESLHMSHIKMNVLIENVIRFMRPELYLKNINLIADIKPEITVECDINQMKQVLFNLLENAIEASTSKRKMIVISLKDLNEHSLEITIRDFGKGMTKERQKHLFEPFYTTKEKGTGLGLMVSKQIMDLHHGAISVESEINVGTIVTLQLPKVQPNTKTS